MSRVFSEIDADGSGFISGLNLSVALCSSGPRSWEKDCPLPDSVPSALREVGHYEALEKVGGVVCFGESITL